MMKWQINVVVSNSAESSVSVNHNSKKNHILQAQSSIEWVDVLEKLHIF